MPLTVKDTATTECVCGVVLGGKIVNEGKGHLFRQFWLLTNLYSDNTLVSKLTYCFCAISCHLNSVSICLPFILTLISLNIACALNSFLAEYLKTVILF